MTRLDRGLLLTLTLVASLCSGAAAMSTSTLVNTIDTSMLSPPSPDPAGLEYHPTNDRLIISDSEVNEVAIFTGVNVWETTLDGTIVATSVTTAFSNEPTGVAYNPGNQHWFFTDDNARRVFEVDLGTDGTLGTADDVVTNFKTSTFGCTDPEGLAYDTDQGHLFVVDGAGAEVYEVDAGPNGVFDGVSPDGDDVVVQFDVEIIGLRDPEGVAYNADAGTLYIVDRRTDIVAETARDGMLISRIDIGFTGIKNPAGIVHAPASTNPADKHLYICDRAVDNGSDPDENDGMIFEITIPVCQDVDGDGRTDCDVDCDDSSNQVWSAPTEVVNVRFDSDHETLRWDPPLLPGAVSILYDTIRSDDVADFDTLATCIETDDGSDLLALDSQAPSSGSAFYYLVRAENGCPSGQGSLGPGDGGARSARSCP